MAGFPVLVVDPNKVQSVDPTSHKVTFRAGSGVGDGGELVTHRRVRISPATVDPRSWSAQEEYDEPFNAPSSGHPGDVGA